MASSAPQNDPIPEADLHARLKQVADDRAAHISRLLGATVTTPQTSITITPSQIHITPCDLSLPLAPRAPALPPLPVRVGTGFDDAQESLRREFEDVEANYITPYLPRILDALSEIPRESFPAMVFMLDYSGSMDFGGLHGRKRYHNLQRMVLLLSRVCGELDIPVSFNIYTSQIDKLYDWNARYNSTSGGGIPAAIMKEVPRGSNYEKIAIDEATNQIKEYERVSTSVSRTTQIVFLSDYAPNQDTTQQVTQLKKEGVGCSYLSIDGDKRLPDSKVNNHLSGFGDEDVFFITDPEDPDTIAAFLRQMASDSDHYLPTKISEVGGDIGALIMNIQNIDTEIHKKQSDPLYYTPEGESMATEVVNLETQKAALEAEKNTLIARETALTARNADPKFKPKLNRENILYGYLQSKKHHKLAQPTVIAPVTPVGATVSRFVSSSTVPEYPTYATGFRFKQPKTYWPNVRDHVLRPTGRGIKKALFAVIDLIDRLRS